MISSSLGFGFPPWAHEAAADTDSRSSLARQEQLSCSASRTASRAAASSSSADGARAWSGRRLLVRGCLPWGDVYGPPTLPAPCLSMMQGVIASRNSSGCCSQKATAQAEVQRAQEVNGKISRQGGGGLAAESSHTSQFSIRKPGTRRKSRRFADRRSAL